MKFRLFFKGTLPGNNCKSEIKNQIRAKLHPQILDLWNQDSLKALNDYRSESYIHSVVKERGPYKFVPLINQIMKLRGELSILLLRPMAPGSVLTEHGDIDNQIKTLIDGLRIPDKRQKLVGNEFPDELGHTIYTLFEDDSFLTGLNVETSRLLAEKEKNKTIAIITVEVTGSFATQTNLDLISNVSI